jgi:hypothetical protein
MTEPQRGQAISGVHDRRTYVGLLGALFRGRHTGVLTVEFGRRWRRLWVWGGDAVLYESDRGAPSFVRSFVVSGVITSEVADGLLGTVDGESVDELLVWSGRLTREQVRAQRAARLEHGIGAPLGWATGTWRWEPLAGADEDGIDPSLLPDGTSMLALWKGVRQHLSMEDVLPTVTALAAAPLRRAPDFDAWLTCFDLEPPFDELGSAIADECTVDTLYRRIPDRSGNLVKLLWMIDAAGLLLTDGREAAAELELLLYPDQRPGGVVRPEPRGRRPIPDSPADTSADDTLQEPKEPARRDVKVDIAGQIDGEHKRRVGRDYYSFLGLTADAPTETIERTCQRLVTRFKVAAEAPAMPEETKAQARELLTGTHLVWRTLSDPRRRAEYDRRMKSGQAPLLRGIKAADERSIHTSPGKHTQATRPATDPASPNEAVHRLADAKKLIAANQHIKALVVLRDLRIDHPSDPDVLAEIGWCAYKAKGGAEDEPEDYLQLALTFEPRHARALEYLARIGVDRGDEVEAKKRLERFLAVEPGANWARRALSGAKASQPAAPQPSRGLRFWRKDS